MGGQAYNLEVAGAAGVGIEEGEREHHLVSRIPWQKGNAHE